MVVERADADLAPRERFIFGCHVGLLHVVKIDFHCAILHTASDLHVVPTFGPRRASSLIDGDHGTRGGVYNKDLAGVRIGLRAEVGVIKVIRVLVAPE